MYFKRGRVKVELGLGRGKKLHDKRATIRERDTQREMDQAARSAMRTGGPRRRGRDEEW
jgi:SsrA-binding protein